MSDIELKPCPYCGGRAETHCESGAFYVGCIDCFMRGPEILEVRAEAEKDAIAVWNKLPRRLCRTTEKPTKPGFYWCKLLKNSYYERNEDISMPVEVVLELEDNYQEFLVVYFLGEAFFKELDDPFFDDSEWADLVPESEEKK